MNATNVFHLKVTLGGLKAPIWRKIAMPGDCSFFDLHVAIQDAFGWQDFHLHQFFTDSPFKRNSRYQYIAFPVPEMEEMIDERKTKIYEWFKEVKDTLWYEYDFGDSWMHDIKLEKIIPREKNIIYPVLLDGKRACPPEDCGGIGGYQNLLEILSDAKNPEHKGILDWLGIENAAEFDSEVFNPATVVFQDSKKRLRAYEKGFRL